MPDSSLDKEVEGLLGKGPEVQWVIELDNFTQLMMDQIKRNAHKGMREAWLEYPLEKTLVYLQISIAELRTALAYGLDVEEKAADVAVYAFILQDVFNNNPALKGIPSDSRYSGD